MSNGSLDSERNDADDVDPGEPIAELAGFEYDVSVSLLDRIRRTIGRRTTAARSPRSLSICLSLFSKNSGLS